jgi:hypothetical protein
MELQKIRPTKPLVVKALAKSAVICFPVHPNRFVPRLHLRPDTTLNIFRNSSCFMPWQGKRLDVEEMDVTYQFLYIPGSSPWVTTKYAPSTAARSIESWSGVMMGFGPK